MSNIVTFLYQSCLDIQKYLINIQKLSQLQYFINQLRIPYPTESIKKKIPYTDKYNFVNRAEIMKLNSIHCMCPILELSEVLSISFLQLLPNVISPWMVVYVRGPSMGQIAAFENSHYKMVWFLYLMAYQPL